MGPVLMFRALFLTLGLMPMSILAVSLFANTEEVKCHEEREYKTDDDICCDKCLPGFKLVETCRGHGYRSNCMPCPEGQFMEKMNFFPKCFRCTRCKENSSQVEESPCSPKKDRVCRCKDSFYKSIIDRQAFDCFKCSTCKINETEVTPCSPERNTECRCKDNYYRSGKNCLLCTNCTAHSECSAFCPRGTHKAEAADSLPVLINAVAGAAVGVVLMLVLVTVVTHFVTKRQTEKKLLSSQSQFTESSKTYEELTTHFEEPLMHSLHSAALQTVPSHEPNLPDCIPREIKIPDVIYSLLDLVPVLRVKQLVRSLGVSDSVIERAELDHRSSREAHYQMLRAWAEQGGAGRGGQSTPAGRGGQGTAGGQGGQSGVLPRALLHELLDKLRLLHLEQSAQELEAQYLLL